MLVVCDIETNRLENPDKIWCIVCKEVETGHVEIFRHPDLSGFIKYSEKVSKWIMHNGIGFDAIHLSRLLTPISNSAVIDTLILSRLVNYSIDGGHGLAAWGQRLGLNKIDFHDFSALTEEMVTYCVRDVELLYRVWTEVFRQYYDSSDWRLAIDLELECACLAESMSNEGFPFDYDGAIKLKEQFTELLSALDKDILNAFPPKTVLVRQIIPVGTKYGTINKKDFRWLEVPNGGRGGGSGSSGNGLDLTSYSIGVPFSLLKYESFNPGSVKQIVERMNEAGWQPTEKTKKHVEVERKLQTCRDKTQRVLLNQELEQLRKTGWKVSETNLLTLPPDAPPAAKKLTQRLITARRLSTLEEWLAAYRPATRRVHGSFITIGAWTQRFAHQGPNFANIVAVRKPWGLEMRSLWRAEPDQYLIDVDADGIQLRVLAHYINDPVFTHALIAGDKNLGTDAHSLNQKALGPVCKTRDVAKTFIYSWLLGAGAGMTAKVLGCSLSEAKNARESFENFYPGLKKLKDVTIPSDASRGYFVGLDGRKVLCDSEHLMLSGYLQNGEAIVMKKAWSIATNNIRREGLPGAFINFVHDEFVYLVPRETEAAERVRNILSVSIKQAGEDLNLNCPMAGNGHIGDSWATVH